MTRLASAIMVVLFAASGARATTSAIGKTISSVSITDATHDVVPTTPFDFLAVAVPKRYRSDRHFLKITTSYQASCYRDEMYGTIDIAGVGAEPDPAHAYFTDREGQDGAPIHFTTRHWFVAPSSLGGPPIPPGAVVTLKLMSALGTGCTRSVGTMVVEIGR